MRYFPQTDPDIEVMLHVLGLDRLEDLFRMVPPESRVAGDLKLPEAMTEWELDNHMDALAASMAVPPQYKLFVGAGRYHHHLPAAVFSLLSRSEFVTSYTPYQPELLQGTLQAIYEYQTYMAWLLGMDVATASHYDGATALAEALLMAVRVTKRSRVALSRAVHPFYRDVVRTYFAPTGFAVVDLPVNRDGVTDLAGLDGAQEWAAAAIQSPNFFGCLEDLRPVAEILHARGALLVAGFTEPLAFGIARNPGQQGADIVAGEGQALGIPLAFGGPGLGILAARKEWMRQLPGRLVGQTRDRRGQRGFVLTLATREQHIRREKATSNICSNNSLCALAAVMVLASLGRTGFRELAQLNHDKAEYLKRGLLQVGFTSIYSGPTYHEFVLRAPPDFPRLYERLLARNIVAGLPLARFDWAWEDQVLFCVTETLTRRDMDTLIEEVRRWNSFSSGAV